MMAVRSACLNAGDDTRRWRPDQIASSDIFGSIVPGRGPSDGVAPGAGDPLNTTPTCTFPVVCWSVNARDTIRMPITMIATGHQRQISKRRKKNISRTNRVPTRIRRPPATRPDRASSCRTFATPTRISPNGQ